MSNNISYNDQNLPKNIITTPNKITKKIDDKIYKLENSTIIKDKNNNNTLLLNTKKISMLESSTISSRNKSANNKDIYVEEILHRSTSEKIKKIIQENQEKIRKKTKKILRTSSALQVRHIKQQIQENNPQNLIIFNNRSQNKQNNTNLKHIFKTDKKSKISKLEANIPNKLIKNISNTNKKNIQHKILINKTTPVNFENLL